MSETEKYKKVKMCEFDKKEECGIFINPRHKCHYPNKKLCDEDKNRK